MTRITLERLGKRYVFDGDQSVSLAIPMDFNGPQPNHFGAPTARAEALSAGPFTGDVRLGGSVNCDQIHVIPHCQGTHTECVGHLCEDRIAISDVLTGGLFLARLISVSPIRADASLDRLDQGHLADDLLISKTLLSDALAPFPGVSDALVIRTKPNHPDKQYRHYVGESPAAYLSQAAAEYLVQIGIQHVVVDIPSLDRAHDNGHLVAHRAFWGMPSGSQRASEATRPTATITELAWISNALEDGWYVLDIQVPAWISDAAPSRPLLYRVLMSE
jgi:kynurenine formamidase